MIVSRISPIHSLKTISSSANGLSTIQSRSIVGFVRNALGLEPPPNPDEPQVSNRFFPWDQSPSEDLRARAARIKKCAKCPVTGKNIEYTCPISGIPTHHSKEAWQKDENYHKNKIYEKLKKVNMYEHDLRSGRSFPEFNFPNAQGMDRAVNLQNWDLYFYTRGFYSMDTEFQLATVTKMLSYPLTIASIMHEFSPYSLYPRGPMTLEGLKSIAALRYTLYPQQHKTATPKDKPTRIFVLGARAESQLPGHVWKQLQYLFPTQSFDIHFIGPECMINQDKLNSEAISVTGGESDKNSSPNEIPSGKPLTKKIDDTLSLIYHPQYFHTLHEAQEFFPYDPYNDIFLTFHPGYASPENQELWMNGTMKALLDTKCAIFTTGFNKSDLLNDVDILQKKYGKELDMLMEPTKNIFGSTKWELNDMNPQEVYQFNMYIAGYRGKRYHAVKYT
ncbi:translational activator for mitochondrial COX1 [Maudiozyma exigua]|uniref:Translational activator for mitochondrial COX1 n=1 Tax=Maudiozyma exigua TaxID=34358 RepID=A0A9P6WD07_MAUEX|nr:translational activator for mitochondrial COX1 [Kazachstania exigua]